MKQVMDGGRLRALALAALAATSGCAIAPAGQRGGGWKNPQGPIADAAAVAPLPHGPLSLDDLVRHALENRPEIRIARGRLASARAEAPRTRAPDVMTVTLAPAPLPYASAPRPKSPAEARAIEGLAEAEAAVVADVKRCYWGLLAIRGEGEAVREDRRAAATVLAAVQARVRAGTAPSRDAARARDVLGESESRLQGAELRERHFRAELARTLSAPPGTLPEIEEPPMGLGVPSGLPQLAPLLDRAVRTAGAGQQERVRQLHAEAARASEAMERNRAGLAPRSRGAFDSALRDYRAGQLDYASLDAARRDLSRCRIDDAQAVPALQSALAALEQAAGPGGAGRAIEAAGSIPALDRAPAIIARAPEPPPIRPAADRRVPPAPATATRRAPIDDDRDPLIIPPISLPQEEPDARPASTGYSPAPPRAAVPTDRRVRPTSAEGDAYDAPRVELGLPAPPSD